MSCPSRNFSPLGRHKLEKGLADLAKPRTSAHYAVQHLRPCLRLLLLAVTAGECIHPEIVRMQLGVFVKSAALRAEVFSITSKAEGLRLQSSEILVASPGVGKGLGVS